MNPPGARYVFWMIVVAALGLLLILNLVGPPPTPVAPLGIVSYEIAGSPQKANAILAAWGPQDQLQAAFSLGLDYLFILVYAAAIGWACMRAGAALSRSGWPLSAAALPAAIAAGVAAACDAFENAALAAILFSGQAVSPWPEAARIAALVKFGLLFACLVYVFLGAAAGLVKAAARP